MKCVQIPKSSTHNDKWKLIRNATSGKCVIKTAQTSSNVSSCLEPLRCDKEPRVVASQEVWPTIPLLVSYFNSYNLIKQGGQSSFSFLCAWHQVYEAL